MVLRLDGNVLTPVSIQTSNLYDSYLFTPGDSIYTWKLGKRLFEGANSMLQSYSDHLLQSHLVIEVFATVTYKTLPYNHPLYKLLYPHIKNVVSLNAISRNPNGLFGHGGLLLTASGLSVQQGHELFDQILAEWSPDVMNVWKYIGLAGLTKKEFPFPYSFRDDGIKYWELIEQYVSKIINLYFNNDIDVHNGIMI